MKHFVRSVLVAMTLLSIPALSAPDKLPSVPTDKQETITLRVGGSSKAVRARGMNRVAIGDPAVAEVDVQDDGVIKLTGLEAGETTLIVWIDTEIRTYRLVVRD